MLLIPAKPAIWQYPSPWIPSGAFKISLPKPTPANLLPFQNHEKPDHHRTLPGDCTFPGCRQKPNILFIYTDDQSHRTVSCYKEAFDWVKTPNIDGLAASGVRFEKAYIGSWCMASRATLLTGHFQHSIESMRMKGQYPGCVYDADKCPFWPSVFRQKGYHTAQIGKWHTGVDSGYGRDWDYQIVWNRTKHVENAPNYYYNQLTEFNGGKAVNVEGYTTDTYTDWAVEYINGKGRDKAKPCTSGSATERCH